MDLIICKLNSPLDTDVRTPSLDLHDLKASLLVRLSWPKRLILIIIIYSSALAALGAPWAAPSPSSGAGSALRLSGAPARAFGPQFSSGLLGYRGTLLSLAWLMACTERQKLALSTAGLARSAAPGELAIGLLGCSAIQHRMMSHSTAMGASVFMASGLVCEHEAR